MFEIYIIYSLLFVLHGILLYYFLYFADTILPVTMTSSLENSLTTQCLRNQGRTEGRGQVDHKVVEAPPPPPLPPSPLRPQ